MSRRLILVAFIVACSLPCALAQQTTDPFVYFRVQRTTSGIDIREMVSECVLVHGDGRFHREHSHQVVGGGRDISVYEGTLDPADLETLRRISVSDSFKQIDGRSEGGRVLHHIDSLTVIVARADGLQRFAFADADDRKKFSTALDPLVNWLNKLGKQKMSAVKNATADSCEVRGRLIFQPTPLSELRICADLKFGGIHAPLSSPDHLK